MKTQTQVIRTEEALSVVDTLKLALEALERNVAVINNIEYADHFDDAIAKLLHNSRADSLWSIKAIKAALEAHKALMSLQDGAQSSVSEHLEPVAWETFALKFANGTRLSYEKPKDLPKYLGCRPLYTTPPQRTAAVGEDKKTWIGLTDEEIEQTVGFKKDSTASLVYFSIARAIEAKLKEKNFS